MTAKLIKICQRRTAWRKIRRPGARHASCGPSHGAAVDPQAGPTATSRPGFHLADPATAVHHATSLTLQPRQPPPAMRPASPCSPGNCRPPCDQSTLQTRQPPSAMRPASPCSPGNRRLPCGPAHLADPATAARPSCRPSSIQTQPLPHGAGGPHAKQTVVSRPRRPSTAKRGRGDSRKGPQLAGVAEGRGAIGRARSRIRQDCGWQDPQPESRRVTGHSRKSPQLAGVAEGRGAIGRARSRIRQRPAGSPTEFFAGFVPFASLNIRFERVQTASQPYFYPRKRFTPRPHTHQIQPVAAPRQRSAPAGGSRDRHPLRLEDSLPFRPSVRHPETHGSGCRFVGS